MITSIARRIQIVLAGDTTGSMGYLREEMRRAFEREARTLSQVFPGIEIAVMFFGDDMNRCEVYPIKVLPFTTDISKVINFIRTTPNTYGGGPHANYERALYEGRLLKWADDAQKVFVVIGDEVPHNPSFRHNDGTSYDWRSELRMLVKMGVRVFGLHCLPGVRPASRSFYEEVARETGGSYLTLDQFNAVGDLILSVAYAQASIDHLRAFEETVRGRGGMTRNADANFARLLKRAASPNFLKPRSDGLVPVPAGQFQILSADPDIDKIDIKEFLAGHGIVLKEVKRYYQFTKPELVQEYKDVVLYDKATGDFFTGQAARRILGLPDSGDVRIKPDQSILAKYTVYIESTSNNRKILGGTVVLVDVSQRKSVRARR